MEQKFVRIPREEYPVRWDKVRKIMKEHDLDMILTYSDERATYGNAYARYYADLQTHFEPALVLFLQDRDPLLLVGPETDGYARERSAVKDIVVLSEFSAEDEDYPFSVVVPLKEILNQYIPGGPKKVGFAPKVHMGATIYEAMLNACSPAKIIEADKLIEPMRGIKSESEIAVICKAYEIAELGMQAAIKAVRPGITERELAAEAEYVMRKAGAEGYGIDPIISSGPNAKHILARTTTRVIEENDAVVITLAPRYEGYHGAIARTILLGNPKPEVKAAVEAMIHAQETCSKNLIPGNVGSEVEAMGRKIMAEAGYEKNFMYSGLHSVGVIEFEPPILGPSSTTVIEKNMVISIDIPLFEDDTVGGMRLEEGYLITEDGPKQMSRIPFMVEK
ncbi:Xaa-Pro peptidase family protein [Candidatus Merdisoma sp. JLR.KK006]|uniref:Xaa-Pro peptidase family protein n=1 Tax=Candidatus Merdisoma sp. JLR.KK006 TaxID=3112626 RepID=UPI002FEED936